MQTEAPILRRAFDLWRRIFDNPIVLKEAKGLMRGRRGMTLFIAYLGALSLLIVLAYFWAKSDGGLSGNRPDSLQEAGKALFGAVVLSELLLIILIAPALTSGAITSERERHTFDLLRVSLLSPRELLFGKLASALAYLLLLICAAAPLQSLAFVFGGVEPAELILSLLMLFLAALQFSAMGLYFSVVARRAVTATIPAYGMTIFPVVLEVVFFYWLMDAPLEDLTDVAQRALLLFLWTLYSTNPLFAAFLSETMLMETQNYFLFFPDFINPALPLFAPWILYSAYALTLTIAMLELTAFYLKRYEY